MLSTCPTRAPGLQHSENKTWFLPMYIPLRGCSAQRQNLGSWFVIARFNKKKHVRIEHYCPAAAQLEHKTWDVDSFIHKYTLRISPAHYIKHGIDILMFRNTDHSDPQTNRQHISTRSINTYYMYKYSSESLHSTSNKTTASISTPTYAYKFRERGLKRAAKRWISNFLIFSFKIDIQQI